MASLVLLTIVSYKCYQYLASTENAASNIKLKYFKSLGHQFTTVTTASTPWCIVIISYTGICQTVNFRCSMWWKYRQDYGIFRFIDNTCNNNNGFCYVFNRNTRCFGSGFGVVIAIAVIECYYWLIATCYVRPSVRLPSRVRSVASTVQDGFFPYLVQMINSMRGCVACDDPWPWPISSKSVGLDLENHARSLVSTVLDGFFLYLTQMITIIIGCVACYVFFRIWKFEFLAFFFKCFGLDLEKTTVLDGFFPYFVQMITTPLLL